MRHILLFTGVAVLVGLASPSARAQSLGNEGDLSIAAERLSGLSLGSIGVDPEGPVDEFETSYTSFRLLTSESTASGPVSAVPVFSSPRIGIDYFLADQLSLGGSLGLVTTSWDNDGDNDFSTTTFLLAVRVGYWIPLNPTFAFWPRGGLTLLTLSQSDDDDDVESSMTLPALSLEAPFMIALGPAFLQLAATLDVAIGGSAETQAGAASTEYDVSAYEIGLQAGLGIVF